MKVEMFSIVIFTSYSIPIPLASGGTRTHKHTQAVVTPLPTQAADALRTLKWASPSIASATEQTVAG